jgi:hypothetical protein
LVRAEFSEDLPKGMSFPEKTLSDHLLVFRTANSTHEIDDEADEQNQAKHADDRTAQVKSATAE